MLGYYGGDGQPENGLTRRTEYGLWALTRVFMIGIPVALLNMQLQTIYTALMVVTPAPVSGSAD